MKRVSLIFGVALCVALGAGSRARAMTELCPASASQFNVLDSAKGSKAGTLFSYELDALSPETVSGTLSIQTDGGWYQVPFGPVTLTGHRESYTMGQTQFDRDNIYSDPIYVRFAEPVKPSRVFVSTVTTDDTAFAWPTKTGLVCDDTSEAFLPASTTPYAKGGDVGPVHSALLALPGAGTPVGMAAKTSVFDSLGCAEPFKDATSTHSVAPHFPYEAMDSVVLVKVIVAVAIDANGKITDDWLVAPSSIGALNDASIAAAEATTFAPAISRCRPVPGVYLLHAEFRKD